MASNLESKEKQQFRLNEWANSVEGGLELEESQFYTSAMYWINESQETLRTVRSNKAKTIDLAWALAREPTPKLELAPLEKLRPKPKLELAPPPPLYDINFM